MSLPIFCIISALFPPFSNNQDLPSEFLFHALDLLRGIKLDTPQQIESMKKELRRQILVIAERREECRNYAKYWERHNVPVYVNIWKQAAKEKTDQMKPLYRELRMCDELMKTGPLARANAIALVQQRFREEERRRLRKELEKARTTQTRVR